MASSNGGAGSAVTAPLEPSASEMRLVIAASSAGTIFEWYDFFIYGALGAILSKTFFPTGNATLEMLLFWLVFAIGFGFRPLGAILFGYFGDRLGRKYTFLVTVTLMGIATAGVGLVPSAESIGIFAPIIVITLRILQGLALGGEYGGAAIYVAEHAPPGKRGFYTSFIQASVVGGFVLSLVVVLGCKLAMSDESWNEWGWRVPFLLSVILLAASLWMRVKLSESPVYRAMKEEGELARNPFIESFTYPGNKRRIFIALFGIAAGLTVIWYTAMFSALSFLKGPMRVDDTAAEIIVGLAAFFGMGFFVYFGKVSDRVGRKKPIIWGYVLTLILLFPIFWMIGAAANPGLNAAASNAPVIIAGPDCSYSPLAKEQPTECGKLLAMLSGKGVHYELAPPADQLITTVGAQSVAGADAAAIDRALSAAGYDFAKQIPPAANILIIFVGLILLSSLSGATYGPVAALLSELFPPHVRYSSMSIPYHIGTGYFGGFLPVIAAYISAKSGDPYSGLWYTWAVVLMAAIVTGFMLHANMTDEPDRQAPE